MFFTFYCFVLFFFFSIQCFFYHRYWLVNLVLLLLFGCWFISRGTSSHRRSSKRNPLKNIEEQKERKKRWFLLNEIKITFFCSFFLKNFNWLICELEGLWTFFRLFNCCYGLLWTQRNVNVTRFVTVFLKLCDTTRHDTLVWHTKWCFCSSHVLFFLLINMTQIKFFRWWKWGSFPCNHNHP